MKLTTQLIFAAAAALAASSAFAQYTGQPGNDTLTAPTAASVPAYAPVPGSAAVSTAAPAAPTAERALDGEILRGSERASWGTENCLYRGGC